MSKLHSTQRFVLTFVAVIVVLALASAATADTIYLKNGRNIRSSRVRVEGDRVFFVQYGGEVSLPLSLVDRIVEDATVEPSALPASATPAAGDPAEEPAQPADPGADVAPEQSPEYWQDRVRTIEAEKGQVQLQIEDLRRTERAFLFSHRSTADTRSSIESAELRLAELDTEMTDLQAEARRAGVPAGWLRLPPGQGVGGVGGAGGSGG